jgi:hypothetical protein
MFCATSTVSIPSIFHVQFTVRFADGTRGKFEVAVMEAWAPQGALHFYQLVEAKFFDNNLVFRVLGWMAQFGLNNYKADKNWILVRSQ